ncbi:MAG: hypothetical protein DRP14_01575 [Candidatus Aenigmatarchaeota archaeon]|nr:MAG: hypothetical protein DRP14_01575 [Candidatus Aenigmarchaeota archaeon]
MEKQILVGGAAGQGIAKTAFLIGKLFANSGYYVFNYRDYPSLIKGGHNFNILKISDKPIYSNENYYDVIIALNQDTIDKHEEKLNEGGFVLGDKNLKAKNLLGFDLSNIIEKLGGSQKLGNDILVGAFFKLFGLKIETVLKTVREIFKNETIEKAVKEGYDLVEQKINLPEPGKKNKFFITGNEAIASGAIVSGIDVYFAYPITPATPVLHILASKQLEHNFMVVQPENEIAVINAALGASYAGAISMVGTSGAGFSLMNEAISLQGISEIPLVLYLSQRTGPATGVPTYNSQGDLKFALNAGHGEFPRVVVAPGDSKECFYRTIESFYLSYKYRILSIILGDKHVGESNYSFDDFEEPKIKPSRFIASPAEDSKSYLITENGVSPRFVPGEKAKSRASSYEHNEYGYTTEKEEWIKKMNEKRFRKMKYIKEEINKMNPVSVYGEGNNLIIGWGSTKGSILDALKKLEDFRFLQISYLSPFPTEFVKKEIENSEELILIENNATGLLGDVIAEQTGKIIEKKILKYDARPFTSEDIIVKVKKILK